MMAADYRHNAYARERRMEKAIALEAHARLLGMGPQDVRDAPPEERRAIERQAKVNKGSDETWALVVKLLRGDPDAAL
jgi:hypothetical protein